MISKENCKPGTRVVVNEKETKWNSSMGIANTGLLCFIFHEHGALPGNEIELHPGTEIEIISTPKRFNGNGNQVKFKYEGYETIMSAWWCNFKHKVNLK